MFRVDIKNATVEIKFNRCLTLGPGLLTDSELEGIAYYYSTGNLYVSDEQKKGTRILELTNEAKFIRIIEPVNQAFLPLSGITPVLKG